MRPAVAGLLPDSFQTVFPAAAPTIEALSRSEIAAVMESYIARI